MENINFNTQERMAYIPNQTSNKSVYLKTEIWTQDSADSDLWHGDNGLLLNTAALELRKTFYNVVAK